MKLLLTYLTAVPLILLYFLNLDDLAMVIHWKLGLTRSKFQNQTFWSLKQLSKHAATAVNLLTVMVSLVVLNHHLVEEKDR